MTTIHVTDAEAAMIRTALTEYAGSIREQARQYRGGYSSQGIELNVRRLNVEALLAALSATPAPEPSDRVIPIDTYSKNEVEAVSAEQAAA